jgi:hypothetical protein
MKPTAPAFQVIRRPQSLEFVLRYGGVTNDEMVRRIEAAGRKISGDAKGVAACFEHEPQEKDVRVTAPLLSEWFTERPTTDAIYAEAKNRRFLELHPSVGLHLAELYTGQPKDELIRVGHKPIPVPARGRFPRVFYVDHDNLGCCLYGIVVPPECTWPLYCRWAFEVPAS